jgi:hypothetical protein
LETSASYLAISFGLPFSSDFAASSLVFAPESFACLTVFSSVKPLTFLVALSNALLSLTFPFLAVSSSFCFFAVSSAILPYSRSAFDAFWTFLCSSSDKKLNFISSDKSSNSPSKRIIDLKLSCTEVKSFPVAVRPFKSSGFPALSEIYPSNVLIFSNAYSRPFGAFPLAIKPERLFFAWFKICCKLPNSASIFNV